MVSADKIKEFLRQVTSIPECREHIDKGRLDKAILLFTIYARKHSNYRDLLWSSLYIYWDDLSGTYGGIAAAIDVINKIVGTNFTCSLRGSDFNKYYASIVVRKDTWAGDVRRNLVAKINSKGDYMLSVDTSKHNLLVFDTEQEARDFLNKSGMLEREAYKNGVVKIEKLPFTSTRATSCDVIRSDPPEVAAVKLPIFNKTGLIDNVLVFLHPSQFRVGPAPEAIIEQYQL